MRNKFNLQDAEWRKAMDESSQAHGGGWRRRPYAVTKISSRATEEGDGIRSTRASLPVQQQQQRGWKVAPLEAWTSWLGRDKVWSAGEVCSTLPEMATPGCDEGALQ